MAAVVDNLIAFRVLSMLVTPFEHTDAYKLGIIDAKGNNLIKARELSTSEQKNAYSYLHRLVFNLKKIINKLPGGESKLKNIVAAYFLFKEAYESRRVSINEHDVASIVALLDNGMTFVEEQLTVEEFLLLEDGGAAGGAGGGGAAGGVANVSMPAGGGSSRVSTDVPAVRRKPKRFARFVVNDDLFRRFSDGKAKYRKWSSYLNMEDEGHKSIYDFAKKNPNSVIILHNGKNTKAIRSWSKKRK